MQSDEARRVRAHMPGGEYLHTDHTLAECLRASHPERPFVETQPDSMARAISGETMTEPSEDMNADDFYDYLDPQGEYREDGPDEEEDPSWSDQAAQDEFIDSAMQYLTEQNPEVPF